MSRNNLTPSEVKNKPSKLNDAVSAMIPSQVKHKASVQNAAVLHTAPAGSSSVSSSAMKSQAKRHDVSYGSLNSSIFVPSPYGASDAAAAHHRKRNREYDDDISDSLPEPRQFLSGHSGELAEEKAKRKDKSQVGPVLSKLAGEKAENKGKSQVVGNVKKGRPRTTSNAEEVLAPKYSAAAIGGKESVNSVTPAAKANIQEAKMCKFFHGKRAYCKNGERCTFKHISHLPGKIKVKQCIQYHGSGLCPNGEYCCFRRRRVHCCE